MLGIWQTSDQSDGTLTKQTSPVQLPGQIRVEDVDGNGKIDASDRKIIGNFQPKWEGGFTNNFSYKGFDLSLVTYARMGQKVVVPYLSGTSGGGTGFSFSIKEDLINIMWIIGHRKTLQMHSQDLMQTRE